ncbi:inositol-3-phosphate synthase [Stygiolobus caldivivus]|uniref:L-myo-inositol-1-phosphate synthase n=1 Tax=Stygiolobus caldivivus TaxID=2824673 RepID=A0A8D5U4M2_9CREN|nr:L-myo-inositol-1-phosphate synthase [Stygiolobus caldivivus]BCU69341.1 L-myo-inositol-1-phosphate synthase [Stygiolobus caldivivus]
MIRVAIVGVGNVASALLQSLEWVKQGKPIYGILTSLPYRPEEIEVVSAFDIDKRKVGKKLSQAIFEKPNVVPKQVDVKNDVIVLRGETLDGREGVLERIVEESDETPVDIISELKKNKVDVVVNLLPTGAQKATEFYAEKSLNAFSSFINTTPSSVVEKFDTKFKESHIPLMGDDLLSQIGGTALHTGIIEFLKSRGVRVTRTYQIDISGTTETLVTLEDWRKELKKDIKSQYISKHSNGTNVVAGTSDYVEFLGDRRVSYMVIEGEYSIGIPVRVDISFKSYDSFNAVVPLIDLIRLAKSLKDKGIGGSVPEICGYYFKKPPVIYDSIEESKKVLMDYVNKVMTEPRLDR